MDPVEGEYAWGNRTWYRDWLYTLANAGTAQERITAGMGEGVGNANSFTSTQGGTDLLRCGIFAASSVNHTRQETGATYWGIMEMTGNALEPLISVGSSQSRDFSGLHGNGSITGSGNASFTLLTDWAFVNAVGVGRKYESVSRRLFINATRTDRVRAHGLRGVRTAN